MDFDTNVLTLEIEYPTIIFNFDYEIDGKILTIPIKGQGPGQIHLSTYRTNTYTSIKNCYFRKFCHNTNVYFKRRKQLL